MKEIPPPGLAMFFRIIGWVGFVSGTFMILSGLGVMGASSGSGFGAAFGVAAGGFALVGGFGLVMSSAMMLAVASALIYLNRIAVLQAESLEALQALHHRRPDAADLGAVGAIVP